MKDALIAMLLAFGASKATAEAEAAKLEADPKAAIDLPKLRSEITSTMKDVLKNDSSFVSEIESSIEGKVKSTAERKLKAKFGLTSEEIKDKKYEEIVDIAYAKATATSSEDSKVLQEKNIQLSAEIKTLKEETIPALEKKGSAEAKQFRIKSKMEQYVEGLEKEDKLRVKKPAALALANAIIYGQYDLDEDETTGEVVLLQKGKTLKAVNKDGTKVLTLADSLTDTFRDNDFLKQSNADDKNQGQQGQQGQEKKKVEVTTGADRQRNNPHMKAAMENAEAVKDIHKKKD